MALGKKTGGRTKGTPNKLTEERRERIKFVLDILESSQESDIQAMTPKERVQLWNDLQEFCTPKLSRQEVKHEGTQQIEVVVKRKE